MDMKKICENQVREMLKYKWMIGEKLGRDPGEDAVVEWVREYAAEYRKSYEKFLEGYVEEVYSEIEEVDLEVAKKVIVAFIDKWCIDRCKGRKHLDEL